MWTPPLLNKTAIVTGSSRGIGLGVANQYVNNGAKVIVSSEQPLDTVLTEVSGMPNAELWNAEISKLRQLLNSGNAHYIKADMRDDDDIAKLFDEAWRLLGTVDILVNNVGVFKEPSFGEITKEQFITAFITNVWSHLNSSQEYVKRRTTEKQGGRLLYTTSINAERSEPGHTLYDMTKAAINALVRQLSLELARRDFTTMGIAAGLHATSITDYGFQNSPEIRSLMESQIPLGIGSIDNVAFWYVAAGVGRYATGSILNVDGGIKAQQFPDRPLAADEGTV